MSAVEPEGQAREPAHPAALRTILFGGTFDPVHNAHLQIARAAAALYPDAGILFIPAANPPHKNRGAHAPYEDRVRMVEIACASEPRFEVSRIEEGTERSYSILTIEKLRHRGRLGFLIGADAFAEIETWHRWQDVVRSTEFIVVTRPGASYAVPPGAVITEISTLQLSESSSEVRRMIAEHKAGIPIPPAVLEYIRTHGLYRS